LSTRKEKLYVFFSIQKFRNNLDNVSYIEIGTNGEEKEAKGRLIGTEDRHGKKYGNFAHFS
jgi:hypothetical protein